jgi:hypothetical protein
MSKHLDDTNQKARTFGDLTAKQIHFAPYCGFSVTQGGTKATGFI